MYKNYFFDLYGTLVDIRTDESLPQLWQEAACWFGEKGIAYDPDELRKKYEILCREVSFRKEAELAGRGGIVRSLAPLPSEGATDPHLAIRPPHHAAASGSFQGFVVNRDEIV